MDYEFHAFDGCGAGGLIGRVHLTSDIAASVRSFDLMRAHPSYRRVVAIREGRPIFQRVRIGDKLQLEWARRGLVPADVATSQTGGVVREAALAGRS
jgi:hypothetical protein